MNRMPFVFRRLQTCPCIFPENIRGKVPALLARKSRGPRLEDAGPLRALATLNEAMTRVPELPLTLELAGERLLIDSSLWCDLAAALVEFDVLQNGCIEELLLDDGNEDLRP